MSLRHPHPLWTSTGQNTYEVSKAIQQARLLSGRFRTESLCRHWSKNKNGWCLSETCHEQVESVEHILLFCNSYNKVRDPHFALWLSHPDPAVNHLLCNAVESQPEYLIQFILDCSVLPEVISATQQNGSLRTFCYTIHRKRLKMLGRWNII